VKAIWQELLRLSDAGRSAALCTITKTAGSTPGKESMRMLVREDGSILGTVGGGCLEAEVLEAALDAMRDERPRTLNFALNERDYPDSGLVCGGQLEIFVEPMVEPRLFIFGGGHVSQALTRAARLVGFHVTVADDRESFASSGRHPDASELVHGDWDHAVEAALERGAEGRYLVVATRGHLDDQHILERLAQSIGDGPLPKYMGMIGSRAKRVTLFKALVDLGVTERFLNAVQSPMGLNIGARTHEEIALSVAAELIRVRRGAPDPTATE
jgi:xanthine dehydrogenase accessory factor